MDDVEFEAVEKSYRAVFRACDGRHVYQPHFYIRRYNPLPVLQDRRADRSARFR
jgi:hypothetical protein